jgi:hypothetical protein
MRAWLLVALSAGGWAVGCGGKVLDGECSRTGHAWSCTSFGNAAATGGTSDAGAAPRTLNVCLWANVAEGAPCYQADCFTCGGTTGTDWVCPPYDPGQRPTWQVAGTYACKQ